MINSFSVIGAGAGSLAGGLIIKIGRRRTLLIFNVLSIFAISLTCFLNVNMIIVGKLLFGFTSGVLNIAAPSMLDETVPIYKLKVFGLATNAYICLGITLAMIMGLGFPEESDIEAMK
jgi:MFS family permease